MTAHRFGGAWTADKLEVLRQYLQLYCTALASQPFQRLYIDAFAGTGHCHVKDGSHAGSIIEGSASIALNTSPGFDRLWFIEPHAPHLAELSALLDRHPHKDRVTLLPERAQTAIPQLLAAHDWIRTRGVMFLDPYGLQCSWQLLTEVARTQAIDVLYLLNISGIVRSASLDMARIGPSLAARLSFVLGTDDWKRAFYADRAPDLFDDVRTERVADWRAILDFATQRLRETFAMVLEPTVLYNHRRRTPLFALYLCVSNPSPPATALAKRLGTAAFKDARLMR